MEYRRVSEVVNAEQWNRLGDLSEDKPLRANGEGRLVQAYHREGLPDTLKCNLCGKAVNEHGWIDPPAAAVTNPQIPVNLVTGEQVIPQQLALAYPKLYVKVGSNDRQVNNEPEETAAINDGFTLRPSSPEIDREPSPEPIPSPIVIETGYPKVFVKIGNPNRAANNKAEEAKARADGFYPGGFHDPYPARTVSDRFDPSSVAPPPMPVAERLDLEGLVVCPGDYVVTLPSGEHQIFKPSDFARLFTKVNPKASGPFAHTS